MTYTKQERERYNLIRQRISDDLNITVNQYNWFRRKANELNNIYINNCNGEYTEEEYILAVEPLEQAILNKATKAGLYVYFQRDPRGASLYLDTQPIPDNNYSKAKKIY